MYRKLKQYYVYNTIYLLIQTSKYFFIYHDPLELFGDKDESRLRVY